MKKTKTAKKSTKPFATVLKKVKALTKRATGMTTGMSAAKGTKKPLVKTQPKVTQKQAAKPSKAPAKTASPKTAAKVAPKVTVHAKPTGKTPPVKPGKTPVPVVADKALAGKKGGKPQVVAAVLTKGSKVEAQTAAPLTVAGKKAKAAKGPSNLNSERMCRENACENVASTKGYCRLDYIKNWKKIKRKEMILKEGKLNQYIEELVGKYPDKYIDVIRQDLSSEVNFNKVIHDLELDESIDDLEYDGDSIDALIGGIRKEDGGFDDTEF